MKCLKCRREVDDIGSIKIIGGYFGDIIYKLCDICKEKLVGELDAYIKTQIPNTKLRDGAALILDGLQELYPNLQITEDMRETPERVARMFAELCGGLQLDPKQILSVTYPAPDPPSLIVSKRIDYVSLCRHHLAIILGDVFIGYIPNEKIVGLSKLARLVECFAKRPQLQEEMTNQIADSLNEYLLPLGVIVVVSGQHGCMTTRGIAKKDAVTVTSAVRGIFLTNDAGCKSEFFELIK
jgi:GTP cyclohydrolase I